jgi:Domain of unknown function DUF29
MALAKEKPLYPVPADIEDDFYAWCFEQAELLRQKRFAEADLPNVIEELESTAKHHRSMLKSSYRLVILHLLKWEYQPDRRARSWELTIVRERNNIEDREEDNLTLKKEAGALVAEVYRRAARQAARETKLPVTTFPADCPYTIDQLRDPDWMPS